MKSEQLLQIPSARELADRIEQITSDVIGVAKALVAVIDVKPEIVQELRALGVNAELVRRLEKLGRGQVHPALVFSSSPAGTKLLSLPLSEQTLALSKGVEVLDPDEVTVRNIPVNELTKKQVGQCFADGKVRSLAEQRTVLREQKAKVAPAERDADFKVHKDHVVTTRPGRWSKQLILQWLMEMK